jgi:flagellar export protein FliJ
MDGKRLKKILDVSKRVERARKGELSNARHEQTLALQQLEHAKREERDQLRALAESGELDVNALYDRARGLSLAAAQVHKAREHQSAADQEVMQRESAAFEAMRDVRKFEILCDRDRDEQRLLAKQAEQKSLDETRRPARKETR